MDLIAIWSGIRTLKAKLTSHVERFECRGAIAQSLSKVRSSATTVNQWGMSHEPPPVVAQPVPAENLATSSEPEEDVPLIDGTLSW